MTTNFCPTCNGDTKVSETRPSPQGVRRRHKCLDCGYRFTTYETERPQLSSPALAAQFEDLLFETQRLERKMQTLISDLLPETDHCIKNNLGIDL